MMEARDIVFVIFAVLALLLGLFNLVYPDKAIRRSKAFASKMGLEQGSPNIFFSRAWARFVGAWAVVIAVIAVVAVLIK